ncbi:cysteine rich repeat-containing protein [Rhodomicrobium sp. Az07]|uniref:cysteine rich repeat-containing protein n=1 Tax=Rhodomicrobium sp. Az07 TaxID=2839034 RepID=UPI001BEB2E62|nr:cysteine rich repeat-containing protein [Rhodomicrobium sp. Az07]MBT3071819.1 cysteine rich repeat-containing protein [Rhodomicrobium sp. Az07]
MRNAVCAVVTAVFLATSAGAMAQYGGHRGTKDEQEACKPDVYRFCAEYVMPPQEDKIVACLKSKRKELRPACRKVIY